jgi:2-oxoisovalerate dehydrogenase E1 component beta subunit
MSDLNQSFPVIVGTDETGEAAEVHEAEFVEVHEIHEAAMEAEASEVIEDAEVVEVVEVAESAEPGEPAREEADEVDSVVSDESSPLEDAAATAPETAPEPAAAPATAASPQPEGPIVVLPLGKALNKGLHDALANDPKVLLMGEDIGPLGGVYRITEGLHAEFGPQRVLDTPLAESGILGAAIGLAMRGYRPVCEIQFDGFVFPAFDQITTQLSRMRNRHEGTVTMPIVVRIPYGGHIGSIEHHSESPEAYFSHTPGLRVVSPSNSHDAYWMIQEAIASNDPVIFLEPKSRYFIKGEVNLTDSVAPLHASRVARVGTDVTVVGHGAILSTLLHAAELAAEEGTSLEVIDLRTLSPLDYGPVLESVRKTGRLVVVQEAAGNASVGSEIAATIAEKAFYFLEAPVIRVSGWDTPYPPSKVESMYLPDADRVLEAVDRSLAF